MSMDESIIDVLEKCAYRYVLSNKETFETVQILNIKLILPIACGFAWDGIKGEITPVVRAPHHGSESIRPSVYPIIPLRADSFKGGHLCL